MHARPPLAHALLPLQPGEADGRRIASTGPLPLRLGLERVPSSVPFVSLFIKGQDTHALLFTLGVLGVTIVGPNASDLISEAALAVELWAEGLDLGLTIHPHPTLGEGMMEAAKHALGEAIHIANKK